MKMITKNHAGTPDYVIKALRKANRDIFWVEFWGWVKLIIIILPFLAYLFAIAYMIYTLSEINCN